MICEKDLKETDNIIAPLEILHVSHQKIPKPPVLKKNTKVQFQFKDMNKLKTAVLISRSCKVTAKYRKEWSRALDKE